MNLCKNPPYVVINDDTQPKALRTVLITEAEPLSFPLSDEDKQILTILEKKFDSEENCAGLAAPQIGFAKQIIVFSAPENPELKKWRKDFTQTMPKTIWINPTYEPIGNATSEDYEGCFSVDDLAGTVKRYKKIRYFAYSPDGTPVSGIAEGFLARIIQHEIDHIHGKLFLSYVEQDKLFSLSEYRRMRKEKLESEE